MTVESLTPINDQDLLVEVKKGIGQGGDYSDGAIMLWINEIKGELRSAGVPHAVVGSTLAVGCITLGVDDIWVSHRETHSDLFYQGVDRLRDVKIAEVTSNG